MSSDRLDLFVALAAVFNILLALALIALAREVRHLRAQVEYLRDARTRDLADGVAVWQRISDLVGIQRETLAFVRTRR